MRYKDIDSQNRFQRAWDAMMAQKPEEKPAPVTPEQEDDTWILMGMLVTGIRSSCQNVPTNHLKIHHQSLMCTYLHFLHHHLQSPSFLPRIAGLVFHLKAHGSEQSY